MLDARFPEVIPIASSTPPNWSRHSRDDPREDVGEEVRVGVRVRVGAVECHLNAAERRRRRVFNHAAAAAYRQSARRRRQNSVGLGL